MAEVKAARSPMKSITAVSLAEMYSMAPTPTVAVTSALSRSSPRQRQTQLMQTNFRSYLRPSLSSRVSESPTMPASEPSREMMSPVERTPVSLPAKAVLGADDLAAVESGDSCSNF